MEACWANSAESTQERVQETNPTTSLVVSNERARRVNDYNPSRPHHQGNTLLMKVIGPVITFVDHPWKVSLILT